VKTCAAPLPPAVRSTFWVQPRVRFVSGLHEAHSTLHQFRDFPAAQVGGEKNYRLRQIHARLSPSVSVALSRIPSSSCHSASEAFSISSNSRNDSFSLSVWLLANSSWVIKGCVSLCPKYPGGEPISFAIFVRVLEFGAIHFDQRSRVPKQNLRGRFHNARLAEPVGPRNSKFPTGLPASSALRKILDRGRPAPARLRSGRRSLNAAPSEIPACRYCAGLDQVADVFSHGRPP